MLLLVGWNISINTQSYHDSTRSFATFLQQQYTGIMDVTNDRPASFNCKFDEASGKLSITEDTGTSIPHDVGQSDCVLLGKVIAIKQGKVAVHAVLGKDIAKGTSATDSEVAFNDAKPTVVFDARFPPQYYTIPWTPSLSGVDGNKDIGYVIAILRSPVTGAVYTRWQTDILANIDIDKPPLRLSKSDALTICFHPEATVTGELQAVRIGKDAASANSVSVLTADSGCAAP